MMVEAMERRVSYENYSGTLPGRPLTTRWYTSEADEWNATTPRTSKSLGASPAVTRSCLDIRTWSNSSDKDNGGFKSNSSDCISDLNGNKRRKPSKIRKLFGSLKNISLSRSYSLRSETQSKGPRVDLFKSKESIEELEEEDVERTASNHQDDYICPYPAMGEDADDGIVPYSPNNACPAGEDIYPYPTQKRSNNERFTAPSNGHALTVSDNDITNDDQIYPLDKRMRDRPLRTVDLNRPTQRPVYMMI